MIKRTISLLLVLIMMFSLVACGGSQPPTTAPSEPEKTTYWYQNENIAINNFAEMVLDFYEFDVTDEDLQLYINYHILYPNAKYNEVMEGVVANDDFIMIEVTTKDESGNIIKDYTTGKDGYTLYVGIGDYLSGLDAAVLGHSVGDTVKFNTPIVIDEKTVNATAEVTIKHFIEVEYPEATDELAQQAGWESIEAFKNEQREKLETEYGQEAYKVFIKNAKSKIIAEVFHHPEDMVQTYVTKYQESLAFYSALYGVTEEQYLSDFIHMTREDWEAHIKKEAIADVETELMLIAIMESLGTSLDEEAYKVYLDRMAEGAGYSSGAALEQEMESQGVSSDLTRELTMNYGYDLLLTFTNLRKIDWLTGEVLVDYVEVGEQHDN